MNIPSNNCIIFELSLTITFWNKSLSVSNFIFKFDEIITNKNRKEIKYLNKIDR